MSALTDSLTSAAVQRGELRFELDGYQKLWTWKELELLSRRIAGAFVARGLRRGDRVALLGTTSPEVVATVRACWMSGLALTMVQPPTVKPAGDPLTHAQQLQSLLKRLDGQLVVDDAFRSVGAALAARFPVHSIAELVEAAPLERFPATKDTDVALVQLTSGSTGEPQLVTISHANLHISVMDMIEASDHARIHEVMLSWLPLHHDMGLIGYLAIPMICGACNVVLIRSTSYAARPAVWLEAVHKFRGTSTAAPNFAYALAGRLLRVARGGYDLSCLRFVLSGGERIDAVQMRGFLEVASADAGMDPLAFVPAYGLAEATLAVSMSRPREGLHSRALGESSQAHVALGPPLRHMAVKIDPSGEILIRGGSVTRGYLDATSPITDGGYWRTGDLGALVDGELYVTGRTREILIVGGRNISPEDVERAAQQVDGVRPGGVVAVASPAGASEQAIVIVETDAAPVDLQRSVRSIVLSQVGISVDVICVPRKSIPRTTSGKLRRLAAAHVMLT